MIIDNMRNHVQSTFTEEINISEFMSLTILFSFKEL
jgi:hypothetical protein